MFELTEPIAVVTYMEDEPTAAVMALGLDDSWDAYFAGRAASAELVDALFYNFADGEVARHIPGVWDKVLPEAANLARQDGSVAALRRLLGDTYDSPSIERAGDTLIEAARMASHAGRALFAAVRTLPVPVEPVARLWFGANLLREHRGDGHVAALVTLGKSGTESHVLHTLADGVPAEQFGRLWHLDSGYLDRVIGRMRERGLVGGDGWLTADGAQLKERLEALTDELAAPAYTSLSEEQLVPLMADLRPLADRLTLNGSST
ncbi:MAG: hypothetical protein R8F63_06395 [Acidimicrobiales bacterium]|nr:hypothetical protein [Acidimicrobiales bacterium]